MEVSPQEPQIGDAAHQGEGGRRVTAPDEPVESGAEVVELSFQSRSPFDSRVPAQAGASLLPQVEVPTGVPFMDFVRLARVGEALAGVLPERLQL